MRDETRQPSGEHVRVTVETARHHACNRLFTLSSVQFTAVIENGFEIISTLDFECPLFLSSSGYVSHFHASLHQQSIPDHCKRSLSYKVHHTVPPRVTVVTPRTTPLTGMDGDDSPRGRGRRGCEHGRGGSRGRGGLVRRGGVVRAASRRRTPFPEKTIN